MLGIALTMTKSLAISDVTLRAVATCAPHVAMGFRLYLAPSKHQPWAGPQCFGRASSLLYSLASAEVSRSRRGFDSRWTSPCLRVRLLIASGRLPRVSSNSLG